MTSGSPRMLVAFTLAAAIILGGIIALATGKWWVLVLAILLHFVVSGLVSQFVFKRLEQGDKPSPTEEARLEDERAGV